MRATLTSNGSALSGKTLSLTIPKGTVSAVTDNGNGTYDFTVTPTASGVYPVTVTYGSTSVRRDALVMSTILAGAGQPLLVPGIVNSDGYEDGITITPDGEYLFIQYGPLYFSGIFLHSTICAEAGWSLYDLTTCPGKDDSNWVFDTIGPYNTSSRPNFPTGEISGGMLTHLQIQIPGIANDIALFPTVFYGFKRQSDGTFAQPFRVAFNDAKGANGPFGLSFQNTGTSATFLMAWNNYFSDGGDDGAEVYYGTMTLGQNKNLGDVAYSGEAFASITPNVTRVMIPNAANQGNPHLYYDNTGTIKSIWVDDESASDNLAVHELTAGTFPSGTWAETTLAAKINTAGEESQPFFTGTRLYFTRDGKIVYHDYLGGSFTLNASWGNEVVVLSSADTAISGLFGFGEPTIAAYGGKTYLYFAYVENRSAGVGAGRTDFDLGAGFIELP